MRLVVEKLAAERGDRVVFADLSFVVEAGTLLRVSGANGVGKTTLLRIIAGLSAATEGNAAWYRADAIVAPTQAACFVGHVNAFNDALTVLENLTYTAALAGLDAAPPQVGTALDAFGVKALRSRRFGTLSQGQRKRCSLARLLLDPKRGDRAWLLDEPFAALDTATQAQLAAVISSELAAGGLVIYTSHQAVEINAANAHEVAL